MNSYNKIKEASLNMNEKYQKEYDHYVLEDSFYSFSILKLLYNDVDSSHTKELEHTKTREQLLLVFGNER